MVDPFDTRVAPCYDCCMSVRKLLRDAMFLSLSEEITELIENPDSDEFADMLDRYLVCAVRTPATVADDLGFARSSVCRWRDGTTKPHPAMQTIVLQYMLEIVRSLIVDIDQATKFLADVKKEGLV